jgi:hypothetical protein
VVETFAAAAGAGTGAGAGTAGAGTAGAAWLFSESLPSLSPAFWQKPLMQTYSPEQSL